MSSRSGRLALSFVVVALLVSLHGACGGDQQGVPPSPDPAAAAAQVRSSDEGDSTSLVEKAHQTCSDALAAFADNGKVDSSGNCVGLYRAAIRASTSESAVADAKCALADAMLLGSDALDVRRDSASALRMFNESAVAGNATAQYMLGFLYSTGAFGVQKSPARALMFTRFAALSGHVGAQLSMAFRFSRGNGMPGADCHQSVKFYELAANAAVDAINPPDTASYRPVVNRLTRLTDAGPYENRAHLDRKDDTVNRVEYAVGRGDSKGHLALGRLLYYGNSRVPQSMEAAATHFRTAADMGELGAMSNLAHMLTMGIGMERDLDAALTLYERAASAGNSAAQNGLAWLHLMGAEGLGDRRNLTEAVLLLEAAAAQGDWQANYNLGVLHLTGGGPVSRNFVAAMNFFSNAGNRGHMLSLHALGHMHLHGLGVVRNCDGAVQMFKRVAEAGPWVGRMALAFGDYEDGRYGRSLLRYALLAEEGYEVAQNNAAWLLEQGLWRELYADAEHEQSHSTDGGDAPLGFVPDQDAADSLAIRWLGESARQGYAAASLKKGDLYYEGRGTPDGLPDYRSAAREYLAASKRLAQASFNLGYMYEFALGLEQDFYLAKRYYDAAAALDDDASVPVQVTLSFLWLHRAALAFLAGKPIPIEWETKGAAAAPGNVEIPDSVAAVVQAVRDALNYVKPAARAKVKAAAADRGSGWFGDVPGMLDRLQSFDAGKWLDENDTAVVVLMMSALVLVAAVINGRGQRRQQVEGLLQQRRG